MILATHGAHGLTQIRPASDGLGGASLARVYIESMIRIGLSLLLLLSSFSAVAQTDLSVRIDGIAEQPTLSAAFGIHATWTSDAAPKNVRLEVDSDGAIEDFNAWDSRIQCEPDSHPLRCSLPSVAAFKSGVYVYIRFPSPGAHRVVARVVSDTPDPQQANNTAVHEIRVAGLPALRPYGVNDLGEGRGFDPGAPVHLRIGVSNEGEAATNVVLRTSLPAGGRMTGPTYPDARCTVSETELVCRLGTMVHWDHVQLGVVFIAPDTADGKPVPFLVKASADQTDFTPGNDVVQGEAPLRRLFAVTNDGDEGPGSLRQAILDSRVFCEWSPCLIRVSAASPLVIQPRTAMPEVRGMVKLDGGSARTTLDGSLLANDGALRFENGCELRVHSFVIRNFKGHAVEAYQDDAGRTGCTYEETLTGASITNSELASNLRGVVTKGMNATIRDNVIRDHARAGIFADDGYFAEIARNQILNNGASGIFIRPAGRSLFYLPSGAEIYNNVIRGNREFGIARTRDGSVHMFGNSIAGNVLYGIDVDLDLDSGPMALKPVIFSAAYRADLGGTVIRGNVTPSIQGGPEGLSLYASTSLSAVGFPQAEELLTNPYPKPNGDFEVTVPRDLRGKWITATGTRTTGVLFSRRLDSKRAPSANYIRTQSSDTSELSNAVKVE